MAAKVVGVISLEDTRHKILYEYTSTTIEGKKAEFAKTTQDFADGALKTIPKKAITEMGFLSNGFYIVFCPWDDANFIDHDRTEKLNQYHDALEILKIYVLPVPEAFIKIAADTGSALERLGKSLLSLLENLDKWVPIALFLYGAYFVYEVTEKVTKGEEE